LLFFGFFLEVYVSWGGAGGGGGVVIAASVDIYSRLPGCHLPFRGKHDVRSHAVGPSNRRDMVRRGRVVG